MKSVIKVFTVIFAMILFSATAMAGVTIKDVKLKKSNQGYAVISLKGELENTPELSIRDRMIQVSIPNSKVWPKIEKKATLGASTFDTTLVAYQFNKSTTRFRIMLPYSLKGKEDQVSLTLRNGKIDVFFPKIKAKNGNRTIALAKPAHRVKIPKKNIIAPKKTAAKYDESYLDRLLKDKTAIKAEKTTAPTREVAATKEVKREDRVNMAFSGNDKKAENKFSLATYAGKFVAFLALVLLLFLGIVQLFKKGVFKKGQLGFLNSTSTVEVLNTTFVGPKKSLIMVRAHNQVFLLGSSDKGIDFLSEINDVTGLIKNGEKEIAGDNFDTSLGTANEENKEFRLKEDTAIATAVANATTIVETNSAESGLARLLEEDKTQDKVRFSDQIKNKVKNLKSLQ